MHGAPEVKLYVQGGDKGPEQAVQPPSEQAVQPPPKPPSSAAKMYIKSETLDVTSGFPPLIRSGVKAAEEPQHVSFVAFEAVEYLVDEGDSLVKLRVLRQGNMESEFDVKWHNVNLTMSPQSFKAQQDWLHFGPGDSEKVIHLEILEDQEWNAESLQTVLLEPLSDKAVLGDPGDCRVVVLNNNLFPHGLPDDRLHDKRKMVWHFFKHISSLMKRETVLGLLYSCWPGLNFVFGQIILLLLINEALNPTKHGNNNRLAYLYVLCAAYVVNFGLSHLFSFLFTGLRLGGKSVIGLRTAIMDTALQFTRAEQLRFPPGKVTRVAESDVLQATDSVWVNSFAFFGAIFSLLCNLAYAWYLNISTADINGADFTVLIILIPLVIAVLNLTVLLFTYDKTAEMAYGGSKKADEVTTTGSEMLDMRSTITTYRKGYTCTQVYRKCHAEYNGIAFSGAVYRNLVRWVARWCATILSAMLLGIVGYLVIQRGYPISNFVTLYNTMASFSTMLSALFDSSFKILEGYGPILKIREVLNADTRRKELKRRAAQREQAVQESKKRPDARDFGSNELRIQGVRYTFDGLKDVVPPVSLGVEAGQVVAVHSLPSAAGKRTLLTLLDRQLLPDEGFIHHPASWHVRYVDAFPSLFNNTLMYNLKFGQMVEHEEEEVWELSRQFGFNPELIGKSSFMVGDNGCHLSYTDAAMVGILRAMLSSPDFVLLPSTLDLLGEALATRVMENLLIFVKERKFECLKTHNAQALYDQGKLVILSSQWGTIEQMANVVVYVGEPMMVVGRNPGRQTTVELSPPGSACGGSGGGGAAAALSQ